MAAYMWNGLQPVTSFTLIPNPNADEGSDERAAAEEALDAWKKKEVCIDRKSIEHR